MWTEEDEGGEDGSVGGEDGAAEEILLEVVSITTCIRDMGDTSSSNKKVSYSEMSVGE